MNTLIVIPTYNEALNLSELMERIVRANAGGDVLIVDDNSPDGTARLANSIFEESGALQASHVLVRNGRRGLGKAYLDGFRFALDRGYDCVVQMDADLSHDPAALPTLILAAQTSDVVIGSRYCAGGSLTEWPVHRRLLSRFAEAYVRLITGVRIADATSGYRCWTRRALTAVELDTMRSEGYSFQVELTWRAVRAGLAVAETPIRFTDRRRGTSKLTGRVLFESALMPWRLRLGHWRPAKPSEPHDSASQSRCV
ncbi:MAG: polyprenol monophosphomannose synthase [Armatimonadetes bacterium]|nr:polyprenol monophosphomannose synthase [Armatimonadota bacterium]MDE2206797.1 polyprenol monophosphomannose synthase [Armatimonadota bacterium]